MRALLFASALALFAACEPTVQIDYLEGVTFALEPTPRACVPGLQAATETVPSTPPPEDEGCDVPLVTRTQGFWKNHPCVVDGEVGGVVLVPVTLGAGLTFGSAAEVSAYLETPSKGGNGQIILGHQLLAAKLDVAAFDIGRYVFADVDGDGALETVDELIALGDEAFDSGSDYDQKRLGAVLDHLNNAGDAASLTFDPACGGAFD
ncbi:hypothetical protein [Polyangium aurulentum]|uniref:hypothetical protein n=1 Tax=Polyangium aurulentum TaxID=2567896 RepID=UPI0010ADBBB3|nr:hypothetical protein [Polyangium aurulentum]UQA58367.1 hypothetical protein E8A73_045170 [Polyangium aurulentum]